MKLANTLKHVSIMILAAGASYAPDTITQSTCASVLGVYLTIAVLAFLGTAMIVPKLGGICNKEGYWFIAKTIANRPVVADACLGASMMMLLVTEHYALASGAFTLIALTSIIRLGVNSYYKYEREEVENTANFVATSSHAA